MHDKAEGDAAFHADIGAPAVRELLRRLDVDKTAEQLRDMADVLGQKFIGIHTFVEFGMAYPLHLPAP